MPQGAGFRAWSFGLRAVLIGSYKPDKLQLLE